MYSSVIFLIVVSVINSAILLTDGLPMACRGPAAPVVIGGTPAPEGSHPHMAAITSGWMFRELFCGGSVITSRSVLTAAHCIVASFSDGKLDTTLRVTVGTNYWEKNGTLYQLSHNVTHPDYNPHTVMNDIGILITVTNIVFTDLVQPIALNYDFQNQGVFTRVGGWGATVTGGDVADKLMEAVLMTISGEECVTGVIEAAKKFNTTASPVDPLTEICTFHSPGVGTCNGDSGTALARMDNCELIGIVSWGFPCARGAPDVFTRVSAFQDWLQNVMV